MSLAVAAPRRWKKPPLIKSAWLRWSLAHRRYGLSRTGVPDHAGELDARVGRSAARRCICVRRSSRRISSAAGSEIAEGIAESLWMTVVSTVVGITLSIPVGIGAAKNIAPAPVYYFCRARARGVAQLPGDHPRHILR